MYYRRIRKLAMEQNIKISVITPTFNDSDFIAETIQSILSQTYKNFELIIVDDCSTDSTKEIIKSFSDSRIVFLKNDKNMGAAFSRNLAISKSTGEYIAFLDGDDVWRPNKLEHQLNFMVKNNYLFSCTNYGIISEKGDYDNKIITAPKIITHKKLLKTSYIGCLTAMYKKSIFPDLQIPDTIYKRNDYALWLRLTEKCDCYLFNETTAYYRKRANSISSGNKGKLIKYHVSMFQKLYGFRKFKAILFSLRNVLYYFVRRIFFIKNGDAK